MKKINKTETLYEILNSKTFTVNVYQREYRWGRKQIEQLINDITDCFLMYYENSKFKHEDTDEVAQYGYYFMGFALLSLIEVLLILLYVIYKIVNSRL